MEFPIPGLHFDAWLAGDQTLADLEVGIPKIHRETSVVLNSGLEITIAQLNQVLSTRLPFTLYQEGNIVGDEVGRTIAELLSDIFPTQTEFVISREDAHKIYLLLLQQYRFARYNRSAINERGFHLLSLRPDDEVVYVVTLEDSGYVKYLTRDILEQFLKANPRFRLETIIIP